MCLIRLRAITDGPSLTIKCVTFNIYTLETDLDIRGLVVPCFSEIFTSCIWYTPFGIFLPHAVALEAQRALLFCMLDRANVQCTTAVLLCRSSGVG